MLNEKSKQLLVVLILKGLQQNVDIYEIDRSVTYKLRIFPYSEVKHGITAFKLTKG